MRYCGASQVAGLETLSAGRLGLLDATRQTGYMAPMKSFISYNGKKYPSLAAACEALGLPYYVIQRRVHRKWTVERALETPIRPRK